MANTSISSASSQLPARTTRVTTAMMSLRRAAAIDTLCSRFPMMCTQ